MVAAALLLGGVTQAQSEDEDEDESSSASLIVEPVDSSEQDSSEPAPLIVEPVEEPEPAAPHPYADVQVFPVERANEAQTFDTAEPAPELRVDSSGNEPVLKWADDQATEKAVETVLDSAQEGAGRWAGPAVTAIEMLNADDASKAADEAVDYARNAAIEKAGEVAADALLGAGGEIAGPVLGGVLDPVSTAPASMDEIDPANPPPYFQQEPSEDSVGEEDDASDAQDSVPAAQTYSPPPMVSHVHSSCSGHCAAAAR